MNRIVFPALLVGGVLLIVMGIYDTHSFRSELYQFFASSSPTDKAFGTFICGIVAAGVGLLGTVRGLKQA